jgi:2-polyprenyl-6-methoxyphenol hydroxylase-like FAD-dependent oxidoreductase
MSPHPVIIVGAGPTGACLAHRLSQHKIPTILIETSRSFDRSFRGEGLMPSGLDAIQQLGLTPILDQIPHRPIDAWEIWIENRRLFRAPEPLSGSQPCTLVSQPAFLNAVIREAQGNGLEFISGTAVQDLLWSGEGDRIMGVRLAGGRELPARLVIACDGRSSSLRQQANLALTPAANEAPLNLLWFKLSGPTTIAQLADNTFYTMLKGSQAFGLFHSAEGHLQLAWTIYGDKETVRAELVDANWVERIAAAAPDWLATYLRSADTSLDRPVLLSVQVGHCPTWWRSGLLLLGDAAHPMSPIRAQGINMALRDGIVAANHLVPLLQSEAEPAAIDAALARIQAERLPEILAVQALQRKELAQAELLRGQPWLRIAASRSAPLLGQLVALSWVRKQVPLRRGVSEVNLQV